MRYAYRTAMDIVKIAMREGDATKTSRADVIRLFMKTLKIDLFGSDLTRILFPSTDASRKLKKDFIPHFPLPKNHTVESRKNMPVGDNTIVSVPWNKKRWGKAICDLACDDFDYTKDNFTGVFFPELQLIQVRNGRHHLALAKLKNQGALTVEVHPLTLCFPYFKTDGAYWIDERSGKKKPVGEIRFAILYALARELWKEENRDASNSS